MARVMEEVVICSSFDGLIDYITQQRYRLVYTGSIENAEGKPSQIISGSLLTMID
jgi:hypothetical protein